MLERASRRDLITLAAAVVVGASSTSAGDDFANRVYVTRYEIILPRGGGGFAVRLTTSGGRVLDVDLPDPDTKAQFMKLVELALGGRGRLTLDVETDGKTIRSFRLEAP